MQYKSRAEYRLKLLVAQGIQLPTEEPSADALRRKLLLLTQEVRFAIFLLLREEGTSLTREKIAESLNSNPDKLYFHLYLLLREGILITERAPDGANNFQISNAFMQSAGDLFWREG